MLNLNHTNRDRKYFDLQETAELIGLTKSEVKRLLKTGVLTAVKLSNMWWVTRSSIESYLQGK